MFRTNSFAGVTARVMPRASSLGATSWHRSMLVLAAQRSEPGYLQVPTRCDQTLLARLEQTMLRIDRPRDDRLGMVVLLPQRVVARFPERDCPSVIATAHSLHSNRHQARFPSGPCGT